MALYLCHLFGSYCNSILQLTSLLLTPMMCRSLACWYNRIFSYLLCVLVTEAHGWREYQDKGKASFRCSSLPCRRTWASLNGIVIFHYRLTASKGEVRLDCPGQKCNVCDNKYEEPNWPRLEIWRSLRNLRQKVKEEFYGEPRKEIDDKQLGGNMTSGHRSDLCQACQRGVCRR